MDVAPKSVPFWAAAWVCWGLSSLCPSVLSSVWGRRAPPELEERRKEPSRLLMWCVGALDHSAAELMGVSAPGELPASLSSSYLSSSVNAAWYHQEAGNFSSYHLTIYWCDYLDLYNLCYVRAAFSPSDSVLGTAVLTRQELHNSPLVRAG